MKDKKQRDSRATHQPLIRKSSTALAFQLRTFPCKILIEKKTKKKIKPTRTNI